MKIEAVKSVIRGTVRAPSSKSAVQRYIAGSLLSEGVSVISPLTLCDDSESALGIASVLGASVTLSGSSAVIKGGFAPLAGKIDCGESGLSARMFTPVAALHDREIIITGKGSLLKRPFDMVEAPLRSLGIEVESGNGYLPLKVKGPLKGGNVTADGSVSSQFITGLLTALPCAASDSVIIAENLVSRPYVDLTIKVLGEFGIEIGNENYRRFSIRGGQKFKPGSFSPEGDWSGAAFLLVMGAIAGKIEVTGLDTASAQADRAVIEALRKAGAKVNVSPGRVSVSGGELRGFEFDITECPDLAPPLTVLALSCNGKTVLKGAGRLAAKESDRGSALEKTMRDIGASVSNYGTHLEIDGGKALRGGHSESFNDHRIAMALAVAALICDSPVVVEGMESINKSYPGFIEDYKRGGGSIRIL